MHELIISPNRAMALALTETGLDREQVFRVRCTLDGGLYDIRFCTGCIWTQKAAKSWAWIPSPWATRRFRTAKAPAYSGR